MKYIGNDVLVKDNVKVELEDIGEGVRGDYNADDSDDVSLLRFYISVLEEDGGWREVEDASYCTELESDAPASVKRMALKKIMDEVYGILHGDTWASVKKVCERLSWMGASDFEER